MTVLIKKVRTFFFLKGVWGRKVISVIFQLNPTFFSDFAPIPGHCFSMNFSTLIHGTGWSKPSFWLIWCDSRGHLVLRSTSITKIYASSNPPCANLCFSFTFVRVNTAIGLKSMAELNLGWFMLLLCLFLFGYSHFHGKREKVNFLTNI